jgi:oligopeptide transport system permease protein
VLKYVIRRLLTAVPTLFLIVTISFFLMRVAPGGPFNQERGLHPTVKANLERVYHLDEPVWKQFLYYLNGLLHLDFGPSYNLPDFTVAELFAEALPVSMALGGAALTLALIVGGVLGVIAALNQNRGADYAVIATATLGSTVPTFVTAPLYQLFFGLMLFWVPVGGWEDGDPLHAIGPIVILALPQIAIVARLTRGSMIEALRSNHVRTARSLGLSGWTIVVKHALRSAILPVISYAGPAAAALLTGSVVVETIFAIPGVGSYFVNGALNRDYTLVMGTVVVIAVFIIAFNLIVDLLYAVIDPRVRYD